MCGSVLPCWSCGFISVLGISSHGAHESACHGTRGIFQEADPSERCLNRKANLEKSNGIALCERKREDKEGLTAESTMGAGLSSAVVSADTAPVVWVYPGSLLEKMFLNNYGVISFQVIRIKWRT